jgi:hypothetical protein
VNTTIKTSGSIKFGVILDWPIDCLLVNKDTDQWSYLSPTPNFCRHLYWHRHPKFFHIDFLSQTSSPTQRGSPPTNASPEARNKIVPRQIRKSSFLSYFQFFLCVSLVFSFITSLCHCIFGIIVL